MNTFALIIILIVGTGVREGGISSSVTEIIFDTRKSCILSKSVIQATKPKKIYGRITMLNISKCFKKN